MAKNLLNDKAILNAKPDEKIKRLNDGEGLYLLVKPNGAKWWRFDYSAGSRYFCESLFWVSQPKQAAKITRPLLPAAPQPS